MGCVDMTEDFGRGWAGEAGVSYLLFQTREKIPTLQAIDLFSGYNFLFNAPMY